MRGLLAVFICAMSITLATSAEAKNLGGCGSEFIKYKKDQSSHKAFATLEGHVPVGAPACGYWYASDQDRDLTAKLALKKCAFAVRKFGWKGKCKIFVKQ